MPTPFPQTPVENKVQKAGSQRKLKRVIDHLFENFQRTSLLGAAGSAHPPLRLCEH